MMTDHSAKFAPECLTVDDKSLISQTPMKYKKLSYRCQTARYCFAKLLRYCRTFCLTSKVWLPDGEKNSKICLFVLT